MTVSIISENEPIKMKYMYTNWHSDQGKNNSTKIQIFKFKMADKCHIGKHVFWP